MHFTLSPVHYPHQLLDAYPAIPSSFRSIHSLLQQDAKQNALVVLPRWDSIFVLVSKLTVQNKRLLQAMPSTERFRFLDPKDLTTEQQQYRYDLLQFARLFATDTLVQDPQGKPVALWADAPLDEGMCIGTIEGYLLSMWSTLQWKYQSFFDTSLFYWFFQKRHALWVHPEILNVLQYYALDFI